MIKLLSLFLSALVFNTVSVAPVESSVVHKSPSFVQTQNELRVENGCQPYQINGFLNVAAYNRAKDLHLTGQWSHEGYEGYIWNYRNYRYIGENLARGFNSDVAMNRRWLASDSHRYNILTCDFDITGVGRYGEIVVQFFADK